MKKSIIFFLFFNVAILAISQNNAKLEIKEIKTQQNGQIEWMTKHEKTATIFKIEEFRWGRWMVLATINGKGEGNNSYTYVLDTTCEIYKTRIKATDTEDHYSKTIKPIYIKEVKLLGCGPNINFNTKTKYEVYDKNKNLLLYDCGKSIDIVSLNLPRGNYYLNYSNKMEEFLHK